jgi:uncharacterized protein YjbI with pentapeptide repeats
MFLDFTNQDLRGRSFQGVNLIGANFSYADIRGANFTDTTLIDANFSHAKAGHQYHRLILLMCVALSLSAICGFAAAFSGLIATDFIFFAVQDGFKFTLIAVGIALMTLAVFCLLVSYQALEMALGASAVVGAIAIALAGVTAIDGVIAGSVAGVLVAVNIAVALVIASTLTMTVILTRSSGVVLALLAIVIGGILGVWLGVGVTNTPSATTTALIVGISTALVGTLLGIYLGRQVFTNEDKFAFLRGIAIALASIGGTTFRNANLSNANFHQATLKNTDFRNANLTHTNFHLAEELDTARVNNTILIDSIIRNLLVKKRGVGKLFIGCNLKGANLAGADLNDANFTASDISEATFVGAYLERANLTQVQAIKTNFEQAKLTAACLEAWNIDSTTQLDNVICDYVYLLNNQSERRPSSGVFAPGEFTKFFQVVLNTVDLIFRNGLDLQALYTALNEVKATNQDTHLAIRSIENKGEGIVVVKVEVTESANKNKIHSEFTQSYQIAIEAIEARYQSQLQSKDEQIALYRQHQADLKQLLQMFAPTDKKITEGKLVILKIGQGSLNTGFPVTLQIAYEGANPFVESIGQLAPAPELILLYNRWQSAYYRTLLVSSRLNIPDTQVTNISRYNFLHECEETAVNFKQNLNRWLNNSENFRPIKEKLLEQLITSEQIRIIFQTDDHYLQKFPFQFWDFFDSYRNSEFALGNTRFKQIETLTHSQSKVRILAILGDNTGIDIQADQKLLQQLPNSEVSFLVEPQRQQINDELWLQPWDILFFAGHSYTESGEVGKIHINKNETLSISLLKNALKKAIEQGLKLAIFNSCDGLGLALNLAELHIPQMIVMREPVPDKVAQEFLKSFLNAFANGQTLYQSVREAREKLQGLENDFPCATWLPVIFQNPAEIPPKWEDIFTVND